MWLFGVYGTGCAGCGTHGSHSRRSQSPSPTVVTCCYRAMAQVKRLTDTFKLACSSRCALCSGVGRTSASRGQHVSQLGGRKSQALGNHSSGCAASILESASAQGHGSTECAPPWFGIIKVWVHACGGTTSVSVPVRSPEWPRSQCGPGPCLGLFLCFISTSLLFSPLLQQRFRFGCAETCRIGHAGIIVKLNGGIPEWRRRRSGRRAKTCRVPTRRRVHSMRRCGFLRV